MLTPTQGQSIIVETPESLQADQDTLRQQQGQKLTSWVADRVQRWEDHRDRGYQRIWAEYWRMWRGKWSEEDKNRSSERSRLIAPALAQAIEMTTSEIEEAVFSRDVWFDIVDNIEDDDKLDALDARDKLLEDFSQANVPDAIGEAVLNGAIFGTGIVKIAVEVREDQKPVRNHADGKLEAKGDERVYVCVESIRPDQFIPDPAGKNIGEMLGCAQRVQKPQHAVLTKIEQGLYRKDALPLLFAQQRTSNSDIDDDDPQSMLSPGESDEVDIIEYHGKVPLNLLRDTLKKKSALDDIIDADIAQDPEEGDGPLVEAIVTIANGSVLLRAQVNPFTMKDRSIIAFQFEKVPGRFWGRGVSEKGYNPQKALDAEIRARIDALGFISSPMLGVDSGRMPRGFKFEIKPGKVWLTQGPPSEVLQPISIGELNANTFNQASEMERMVQMGTGAFDTASALGSQSQSGANSLSSNSMLMGAFVKRAKRSVQNVDRNLLTPVIKKSMWRYMQFAPRRYPNDYDFVVKATMGIVAREVEAMQMTQTIGMIPEQFSQVSLTLVQGIIEHSALPNKAQILRQINEALKPPSEEAQAKQKQLSDLEFEAAKGKAQGVLLENQKTMAEIRKLLAEAQAVSRKGDLDDDKLIQAHRELELQGEELKTFSEQNQIALRRVSQQDRALDLKEEEINIKRTGANKPSAN